MKKFIALFLGCIILLQSCSVYKPTAFPDIKEGKNYIITMTSGKEIEAKCTSIIDGAAYFGINDSDVKIPFNKIKELKRKKISPLIFVGGLAVAVATAIFVVRSNKKENIVGEE